MRTLALLLLLLGACRGPAPTNQRTDTSSGGGDPASDTPDCSPPEGSAPIAVRVLDRYGPSAGGAEPDLVVQQWDGIPPSDQPRHVRLFVHEQPDASLAYSVDRAGTLVLGIRVVPYCGGAYPDSAQLDFEIPPWPGPIEVATCFAGSATPCPMDLP